MRLPDGTILMHTDENGVQHAYDPVKAHAYYIKNRQLKGRHKGVVDQLVSDLPKPKGPPKGIRPKKVDPKKQAAQRAAALQRVNSLKEKLVELNKNLKERLAEARKADAKEKRGPTAADKADAARESKKYRDKHKSEIASKAKKAAAKDKASDTPKRDTVESLEREISEVQGRLTAAVKKLRALSTAS